MIAAHRDVIEAVLDVLARSASHPGTVARSGEVAILGSALVARRFQIRLVRTEMRRHEI
jgi:hypothetical protein